MELTDNAIFCWSISRKNFFAERHILGSENIENTKNINISQIFQENQLFVCF
jgi:hypothetical protein